MENKNQKIEALKKANGNLIELTVKDVTKIKGGRIKIREKARK